MLQFRHVRANVHKFVKTEKKSIDVLLKSYTDVTRLIDPYTPQTLVVQIIVAKFRQDKSSYMKLHSFEHMYSLRGLL